MRNWLPGKFILLAALPLVVFVWLRRAFPVAAQLLVLFGWQMAKTWIGSIKIRGEQTTTVLPEPVVTPRQRTGLTSFTKALLWLGVLMTLAVVGDLVARGFQREIAVPVWELSKDDPDFGRQAIIRHGCGGCHVIPGIRHAVGRVGPQLNGFRNQIFIAGVLPNVPDNLILWIQDPQGVNPQTAMPNLQVTEAEAREIAVYLYAQP